MMPLKRLWFDCTQGRGLVCSPGVLEALHLRRAPLILDRRCSDIDFVPGLSGRAQIRHEPTAPWTAMTPDEVSAAVDVIDRAARLARAIIEGEST